MAKDDKTNEEEDDFFGDDDDDFGLPELEYESLDDSDDSFEEDFDEIGESSFEDTEESPSSESVVDEVSPDSIEIETDDLGTDHEPDDFYKEESFEDFESSLGTDEVPDSVLDSDVLDEEEFAKFEKELEEQGGLGIGDDEDNEIEQDKAAKGKFTRIVIIGAVIFLALGTAFYFMWDSSSADEKATVAQSGHKKSAEKKPAPKKVASKKSPAKGGSEKPAAKKTKPAAKKTKPATKKSKAKSVASTPGTVNELSAPTGNYFLIIGSFLDDDLARDYTTKLASEGKSPTIIPPFGKAITYRVGIEGYGDLASAQQNLDSYKGQFGEDIWILKY